MAGENTRARIRSMCFITNSARGTVAAVSAWVLACILLARSAPGAMYIVESGAPRAQIVIGADAVRTVRPAAEELQRCLEKISGAHLPIVTPDALDPALPVRLYVGRSKETDRLGITGEDLHDGAFRLVAGPDYLVLLGQDRAFVPREPYPLTANDADRVRREWDALTGGLWENPLVSGGQALWRHYSRELDLWAFDTFGSYNAVCAFLRGLGMRWYLPGALGEIVPKQASIELPAVNQTVRPDFPLRYAYQYGQRFSGMSRDELLWQLRMGFHLGEEVVGPIYVAHGTANVIKRDEMKKAHPEYYALIGGVRQNGDKYKPCLSCEGMIEENVRFARAVFDIYDVPMLSVMPTDGFTSICQCEECKGQATPERGWEGAFSDYVWTYVDRVAREVYKTHPDRKIIAMAYTTYKLPPATIEKLSPNIVVLVAQGRCYFGSDATRRERFEALRRDWLPKLPAGERALAQYEYYRWSVPGKGYESIPAFAPHAVARDLSSLKGISLGDYIEVHRAGGLYTMGVTGLNLYVTGRCWWDADLDIDALLEEYYTLYYGPAREEMKALIEYAEVNFVDMRQDAARIKRVLDLAAAAQAKVASPVDDVYARRVALVADYIAPLNDLRAQLLVGRDLENLPRVVARDFSGGKDWAGMDRSITVDGKLDDTFWSGVTANGTGQLKDRATGRTPAQQTSFKVAWADGSIYLGITALDDDMAHLAIATDRAGDMAIWSGDCVEILVETQSHSYYQLAINPAGAMIDVDRKRGIDTRWSSDAEVAVCRGDDRWTIEVRIPLADESQADLDALNGMAGRKPNDTYPWFFNVCRQRVRDDVREYSALSVSEKGFHDVTKFAQLTMR